VVQRALCWPGAAKSREPVVVAGSYGKDRYVACGMANNDKKVAPSGAERILLDNTV